MSAPAIWVHQLEKRFSPTGAPAVSGLDFEIQPGESVAFLGPNGAGKSTTIKMLCGILTPTAGKSTILGFESGSIDANRNLGLVFGTRSQLHLHMTVAHCLDLMAEIYGVTGIQKRTRIAELADLFHLHPLLKQRVRSLSLGQRMRCELVAALIHKPKVLLADEPTIGLDIVAKNQLRDLVQRWQIEEKATLLLTSHDLSDVEALCDRCILIDHGVKRYDGTLDGLKGDLASIRRIEILTQVALAQPLTTEPRLRIKKSEHEYSHLYELTTTDLNMAEGLALLSQHYGNDLQDIRITEVTLEEVLWNQYSRNR